MTIHILCTARGRDRVALGPFTYCAPLDDGVGDIMTIHILCTARRWGSGRIMTIHILCTGRL